MARCSGRIPSKKAYFIMDWWMAFIKWFEGSANCSRLPVYHHTPACLLIEEYAPPGLVTAHPFLSAGTHGQIQPWTRSQRRRLQAIGQRDQFSAHELVAIHATHRHAHVGE